MTLHGIELRRSIGGYVAEIGRIKVRFTVTSEGVDVRVIQQNFEKTTIRKRTLGEAVLFAKVALGVEPRMPVCRPEPMDDAQGYVGDELDGAYYFAQEGPLGGFFVSLLLDSDTGAYCMAGTLDDGPYETLAEAQEAGHDMAVEFCLEQEIDFDDPLAAV
jgi:hypothetical protein